MEHGVEQVMAKLLQDFEQGKLNRRQLIQSLSLAAMTVAAAIVAPTAEAAGRTLHVASVNHISYQVPDYTKIRDFYSDLFGMKVSQDTGKQCYLSFGDSTVIARNAHSSVPRIDHIAYAIDNWDQAAVETELKRRGLKPRLDQESFHIKDPAGFDVQITKPIFLASISPKSAK